MKKWLFFMLTFLFIQTAPAAKKPKIISSVPFEMVGSYVVVVVKINDSSPLRLILDTGIRNTIITELQEDDKITLNYSNVTDLMGLGGGDHLEAYSSNFNNMKIGKLKLMNKTVYVLKNDIFNLSQHTGTKINGLIGMDLFQDNIVEINYNNKRIYFYASEINSTPKGYEKTELTIEGKKIFAQLKVLDNDSTYKNVKMLIDTGAELNAWFQTFTPESILLPHKTVPGTIGQGLNGEITGKIGKIKQLCIGSFCLTNPIVSFPDSACIYDIVGNSKRDGTIGSQILSRFNYIIDFTNKQFYFKPNSNFKAPFHYNVAGIEIVQIIPQLPVKEIWRIWKNSPAALAGLKAGDQLVEINGEKAYALSINEILGYFEKPSAQLLKIIVQRDGKELTFQLEIKDKL